MTKTRRHSGYRMKKTRKVGRKTRRRVHRGGEAAPNNKFTQMNPMVMQERNKLARDAAIKIFGGIKNKLDSRTVTSVWNGLDSEQWDLDFCTGKKEITKQEFKINDMEIDALIADLKTVANSKAGFFNSKGQKTIKRAKMIIKYITDLKTKGVASLSSCQDFSDISKFLKLHFNISLK